MNDPNADRKALLVSWLFLISSPTNAPTKGPTMIPNGGKKNTSTYKKMQYDIDELANTIKYARSELIDLEVSGKAFTTVNDDGVRGLFGSKAEAHVGFGQPNELTKRLLGKNNIALFF